MRKEILMKVTHDFHIHTDLSICANETATLDNNREHNLHLEVIRNG